MLDKGGARRPTSVPAGVRIVDPVYVEDDVTLIDSTIGPNVSISAGSRVEQSTLVDTIVGSGATVRNATLSKSLIGDGATVEGVIGKVNVVDHSSVVEDGSRYASQALSRHGLSFGILYRR